MISRRKKKQVLSKEEIENLIYTPVADERTWLLVGGRRGGGRPQQRPELLHAEPGHGPLEQRLLLLAQDGRIRLLCTERPRSRCKGKDSQERGSRYKLALLNPPRHSEFLMSALPVQAFLLLGKKWLACGWGTWCGCSWGNPGCGGFCSNGCA